MNFKELMQSRPKQWGLRGDPYLWDEIRQHLANVRVPINQDTLTQIIQQAFEDITGQPINNGSNIFIERYSQGGISSGRVSSHFWNNKAIPFLIQNNEKKQQNNIFLNSNIDISSMYEVLKDYVRINKEDNTIKIEVLSIHWDGPHTPISNWTLYKELPLDCKLNIEINAVLRSKHFGYCESCNSYNAVGHMHTKKMCQCCASQHLGLVY